jgi:hypothetical protein
MSAEPEEEEEVPKKIYTFNQEGRLLDQVYTFNYHEKLYKELRIKILLNSLIRRIMKSYAFKLLKIYIR